MAFIIDTYNKYDRFDREHTCYTFEMNGSWYAIKKIILNWGQPQLAPSILYDINPETYHLYESFEDAYEFVRTLKHLTNL